MEFVDGGALTDVIFANENQLTEAHIAFVCYKVDVLMNERVPLSVSALKAEPFLY
tara:strand:+ start:462 stop:626 length:165 start_codon:yes stop_codon:yes gene_type:complete